MTPAAEPGRPLRFPIRFTGQNRYLWLLGVRPSRSWVGVAALLRPRVRDLRVSVEDPDGLLRALALSA